MESTRLKHVSGDLWPSHRKCTITTSATRHVRIQMTKTWPKQASVPGIETKMNSVRRTEFHQCTFPQDLIKPLKCRDWRWRRRRSTELDSTTRADQMEEQDEPHQRQLSPTVSAFCCSVWSSRLSKSYSIPCKIPSLWFTVISSFLPGWRRICYTGREA